ncbi:hypothetical protein GGR88_002140 [Sphingomonas jejuensis]|uniref:Enoyl reductase (ER) domain-containing protein n=1 Tax=Sphingomonas jejuensis TaxID=904715 RepID=A0ABX0XPK7_9SPHN|nr:NADP-dependent oxidoreductase [Sphingomonas jejuensis]NJC34626.1 hypothetical protein [Sphingomonas jejuensis]
MASGWHLARRPKGMPVPDDFALRPLPGRPLTDGEVRVANRWLSVDPYMRARMSEAKNYIAGFQIDEVMEGGAVGEVVESRNPDLPVGTAVLHMAGWRDEAVLSPADRPTRLPDVGLPLDHWLHDMGLTGGTAWIGLTRIAEAKAGEILFVSAAAGAVGSAVVQIGKAMGLTVIGSAGGADKCAWVRELGADATIDYKAGPVGEALRTAAPDGIDIYFDNVGGDHLDAALLSARLNARFAICGLIEGYNRGGGTTLNGLFRIIQQRIRIEGFLYTDHVRALPEFHGQMLAWIKEGRMKSRTTVKVGLESMPDAFLGLFSGHNVGKMLVRL